MIEFLSDSIWQRISILSRKATDRKVIVPYLSTGQLITFYDGDILITNATNGSIKSGQTDAKILEKAYRSGCKVYSNSNLHAKIYLFDHIAIVGSNNISRNSELNLIESAILTDHPTIISGVTQMINQLVVMSDKVDKNFISRIKKIPVVKSKWPTIKAKPKIQIEKPNSWITFIGDDVEYPGNEEEVEDELANLKTQYKRELQTDKKLHRFYFYGNRGFDNNAKIGDLLTIIRRPLLKSNSTVNVLVYKAGVIKRISESKGKKYLKNYYCIYPHDVSETPLPWSRFLLAVKQVGMYDTFHLKMRRKVDYNKTLKLLDIWNTLPK